MSLKVFSSCPASSAVACTAYRQTVVNVARWSEKLGCTGILVYTDNSLVDPWIVAQVIVESTERLCPLVAIQPAYMHPYTVAKMVSTFGYLYGRQLYLNMVAGGFRNDLAALDDQTAHDARYERLLEYTSIVRDLLAGDRAVSYEGKFYRVERLKLTPPLARELAPGIFVSGSSDAGMAVAHAIGATAVEYPKPAGECVGRRGKGLGGLGLRVGIVARPREVEAWSVARGRFPEERKGRVMHQLAMRTSDSAWHARLSTTTETGEGEPYWLVPFQNYKTFCPYLVGSYERVGGEVSRYIEAGYDTVILDVPVSEEELTHVMLALRWGEGLAV